MSPDPVSAEREKLEKIKAAMQEDDVVVEGAEREMEGDVSIDESVETTKEIPVSSFAEDQDKKASEQIAKMEEKSRMEAESSTVISMTGGADESRESTSEGESEEVEYTDQKLDKAITRLKSKVESMVGNIEAQLSNVEEQIGDKLHFLDKDMDGILSREEMAICLQTVLKRPLTFDEAMEIAKDMVSIRSVNSLS